MRVLYTVEAKVSFMYPNPPLPKLVVVEVVLMMILSFKYLMASYDSSPVMRVRTGRGMLLLILLMDALMVVDVSAVVEVRLRG